MNVLLDEQGHAKLGDFGLAQVKQETTNMMTQASVGTLAWMAPELFKRGARSTKATDVYSLGMIFWELVSRKMPFADAANANLIPVWVQQGERETIPPNTPTWYQEIIKGCWPDDPQKRLNMEVIVKQLAEHLEALRSEKIEETDSEESKFAAFQELSSGLLSNSTSELMKSNSDNYLNTSTSTQSGLLGAMQSRAGNYSEGAQRSQQSYLGENNTTRYSQSVIKGLTGRGGAGSFADSRDLFFAEEEKNEISKPKI